MAFEVSKLKGSLVQCGHDGKPGTEQELLRERALHDAHEKERMLYELTEDAKYLTAATAYAMTVAN